MATLEDNAASVLCAAEDVEKARPARTAIDRASFARKLQEREAPCPCSARRQLETEVEERKRVEERLRHYSRELEAANRCLEEYSFMAQAATRAKSEFLSSVSHEIRTPLNGIIGFAEIILGSGSIEEIHLQAQTILQESEHLLALINDVLDDAKIEVGKVELERKPLDLGQLLDSVQRTVRVQVAVKGLEFTMHLDPVMPRYVVGDVVRLRQVLLNLLSNAVKFTEHGSVTLRVEMMGKENGRARLRFSVIDTGIGIPRDKQSLVFQSFTQVNGGSTRRYGGTGLGTSIARKLVHFMEGEIGLESEPGKGSTFWFTVPLEVCSNPPAPEELATVPETPLPCAIAVPQRSARILLAEDYPVNQELARLHLESVGYRVDVAATGVEAVEACRAARYDIVLMDLHMPEMDGYEATRRIRALGGRHVRIPILGVTADASPRTLQSCREAGLDEVVVKPVRRNSFLAVIGRWLKQEGPTRAAPEPEPSPTPSDPREAPPLSYEKAVGEFGGNQSLLDRALTQFVQTVQTQSAAVREALRRGDRETVRHEAHRIRGGAANLTAYPLASVAGRLEDLAMQGSPADALRTWDDFENEFERFKRCLADRSR